MKIAVPTRDEHVDAHFGHCAYYTVFSIDDQNRIAGSELIASPQGCGCKSNIAEILMNEGVKVMLAGNMGDGALYTLARFGIDVVRGCDGPVEEVVNAWLKGQVLDSGLGCEHHHHHHEKGENHSCH
jgi:predicted Fe-Mo cluster-binding NifX family protein